MRKKLTLALYLGFVELLSYMLVVFPAYSFQVSSSTTGYVRVASAAAVSSYQAAKLATQAAAVGTAIAGSSSGASMALRVVAGASWPALGILVGLTLLQVYYSGTKADAVKAAAAGPGTSSVPGWSGSISALGNCPNAADYKCQAGYDQYFETQVPAAGFTSCGPSFTGWYSFGVTAVGGGIYTCRFYHFPTSPTTLGTTNPAAPATASQVAAYVQGLSSSDPNSIQQNMTQVGAQSQPLAADQVVTQPATTTEIPTTVTPATNVQPTDLVVDPNAPQPTGTVTNNTTNTTTTTTTTTTTNPDGSTTSTHADTATASCTSGNHEQRTFGSILQGHMNRWAGSGLLSALNLLKTLTWPTAIPTYSLQSNLLGTFTLDFSAWSGMLTALRSIVIAVAGFVAYKIVFVGAR
jgi:hypothetical protein